MDDTVADVAERALAILDELGWAKDENVMRRFDGPVCLGLALKLAVRGRDDGVSSVFVLRDKVWRAAEEVIGGDVAEGAMVIANWNDAPERTSAWS